MPTVCMTSQVHYLTRHCVLKIAFCPESWYACLCVRPQAIRSYLCESKRSLNNQSNKSYCFSVSLYVTSSAKTLHVSVQILTHF